LTDTYASLKKLFKPKSVAIVGASEDVEKLSGQPLRNLIKVGFKQNVFPVNPRIESIDGMKCYKSLQDIGQSIDVAIICLPAEKAIDSVEECLNLNVPIAIIAVSGFGEMGTEKGKQLQDRLSSLAAKGIRIVGPNCNGIYNIHDRISIGYNVTHSWVLDKGGVAVLSHSGALFSSIVALGSTYGKGLGFSYFVSAGNEADLNLADYLEYMIRDNNTRVIAMILDSVHQIEKFRQLCQEARARGKYLVAMKIGNSETGVQATLAHSARLSGSSRSYNALFEECGVIKVDNLEALVGACTILEKYNLNGKSGLSGMSTSGAGCAVMADTAELFGLRFPTISQTTADGLSKHIGFSRPMNPYDIAGATTAMGYVSETLATDESVGFMLFYSTILQTEKHRTDLANHFSSTCYKLNRMPFLVIAPGPLSPEEMSIYQQNDIIVFNNSDNVFQILKSLNDANNYIYSDNDEEVSAGNNYLTGQIDLLNYENLSQILDDLEIQQPQQVYVEDLDQITEICHQIGYPIVIKGISSESTHKSDMGLVWTDVISDDDVNKIRQTLRNFIDKAVKIDGVLIQEFIKGEAEVLIGVNKDPDVGYVLVIGSGGKYAEVYNDIETCTIPASRDKIRRMLLKTKVGQVLNGSRNNGLTPEPIVDIAFRLQSIVQAGGIGIQSIDLNPIIVNTKKAVAVDVRIL
jgi:acyl-CoA synthetase (NDP forming)